MACVPYSLLFCCLELQCYGWTSSATLDHKDEDSILRMAEWKVEGSLSPYDHGAVTPALDFLLKFFWEINFCIFNHFRLETIQGDTSVISENKELGERSQTLPFLSLIHQTQFREGNSPLPHKGTSLFSWYSPVFLQICFQFIFSVYILTFLLYLSTPKSITFSAKIYSHSGLLRLHTKYNEHN